MAPGDVALALALALIELLAARVVVLGVITATSFQLSAIMVVKAVLVSPAVPAPLPPLLLALALALALVVEQDLKVVVSEVRVVALLGEVGRHLAPVLAHETGLLGLEELQHVGQGLAAQSPADNATEGGSTTAHISTQMQTHMHTHTRERERQRQRKRQTAGSTGGGALTGYSGERCTSRTPAAGAPRPCARRAR